MIRKLLVLVMVLISKNAIAQITVSDIEGLHIAISSQVTPIPLNQMHNWIITLKTDDGAAVESATIRIDGGMPAHNHGLATSPQVTEYLGNGEYLLEGLRFHMPGEWLMQIQIDHDGNRYRSEARFQL